MLSSEKMRRVRERRKRAGLCPQCGETQPEAGRAACRPCLDYNATVQRSRYNEVRRTHNLVSHGRNVLPATDRA